MLVRSKRMEEQTRRMQVKAQSFADAILKEKGFPTPAEQMQKTPDLDDLIQYIIDNIVDMTEQEAAKLVKDTKREYDALLKGKNSILDTGGNGKPSATPLFAFTLGLIIGLSTLSVIEFIIKPLALIVKEWFLL